MKQCSKCHESYSDDLEKCPKCDIELESYQKLQSKLSKMALNLKLYKLIIISVAIVIVICASYFCGTLKEYDDKYISEAFQSRKNEFENVTKAQKSYDEHQAEKENLNTAISRLQNQLNSILDFEDKQDEHNTEINNLSEQANDLSSQKSQKEKTLNDIEYELSQY